jgi:hypothetical protein
MSDQWQVEPAGPGVLGRLLVPQSSTKPAVTAFLAGVAGAGAFVASLVLDWQKITLATDLPSSSSSSSSRSSAPDEVVLNAGLGSVDSLGLVYILGTLGLLTMLGAVLVRPESALRMRMGAAGLGVGLVGVLVAITLRLPETVFNIQGIFGGLSTELYQEMTDRSTVAYESGMFVAFAAVVLLSAAVWLAGSPSARAAAQWAAFAAAYPAYAAYHSAQYHGGSMYPPPPPNAPMAPTQTGNGAALAGQPVTASVPVGSVPSLAPSYQSYAPPPSSAPPYPAPPASTSPYAPPATASLYAPPPASMYAPPPASMYAPPPDAPPPPSTWTRAGHVDELTVTPSEPLDPGTSPEMWRS